MWLKRLCEKNNITVYKLAERSGLNVSALNMIVHNDADVYKLRVETAMLIAGAFNMTVEALVRFAVEK